MLQRSAAAAADEDDDSDDDGWLLILCLCYRDLLVAVQQLDLSLPSKSAFLLTSVEYLSLLLS